MINMLRADFYRTFRGKAIYIALVILLFMIATGIYTVQPGYLGISATVGDSSEYESTAQENVMGDLTYEEFTAMSIRDLRKLMLKTEGYELDRDILSNNMNLYYIFIFVAAISIAADFSGSCVKNTLASAISRKKYFVSKVVFVNLCCVMLFFLHTYIVYFANIIFNNKNLASSLETVTKISLLQLPVVFALASILTGLAFALKRTALFNTVTIPLIMIFQLLLRLTSTLFKIKAKYLVYDFQMMFIKLANNPSHDYKVNSYLLCAGVMIAFYLLGYLTFRKTEIK